MLLRSTGLIVLALGACSRVPEPDPTETPSTTLAPAAAPSDAETAPSQEPSRALIPSAEAGETAACVIGMDQTPPATAESLQECPQDPAGRPTMPLGGVVFDEAPHSPSLKVELALTVPHKTHGLMYRPTLSDEEGMLFSWPQNEPRSFWMRNTCLALDMLFIDKDGFIAGVLEQVPPWNRESRALRCPVAHVLEVRAGWTRDHGVKPGQRVTITHD